MSSPNGGRSPGYEQSAPAQDQQDQKKYSPPPQVKRFGNAEDIASSTTLFVGNLPYDIREDDLAQLFGSDKIKHKKVGVNKKTNNSLGYAFVEFYSRQDAEAAFQQFTNYEYRGRNLRLDWDVGQDKKRTMQHNRPPRYAPYRRRGYSPRRSPPRRYRGRSRSRSRSRSPPRRKRHSYSRSPSPAYRRHRPRRSYSRSPSPRYK